MSLIFSCNKWCIFYSYTEFKNPRVLFITRYHQIFITILSLLMFCCDIFLYWLSHILCGDFSLLFSLQVPHPLFFFSPHKTIETSTKKKKKFFFQCIYYMYFWGIKNKRCTLSKALEKKIKHETHYINLGFINSVFFFFPLRSKSMSQLYIKGLYLF